MKNRILALCFVIMTSIGTILASNTQVDGIWYDFHLGFTADVTYRGDYYMSYPDEYTGTVIIPSSVRYNYNLYSVTSIDFGAFCGCTGLTSVTIPNSVTRIEDAAFGACTGLTSIEIPNSITDIGSDAFSECAGLTSVTIPSSVTSLEARAFIDCPNLTSVTINSSTIMSQNHSPSTSMMHIFGEQVSEYIIGQ